jgi:5-formyltetrahydrofolate cyclo-ligase
MTPPEIKALRRREMAIRLKQVTPNERLEASKKIGEQLYREPAWRSARAVLLYAPLMDEIDLWPAVLTALETGKLVTLPAFDPATRTYLIRQIKDPQNDLVIGHYGIREPKATGVKFSLKQLDLCIAPGVGFSDAGVRLGRGAGYYDRLLADFTGRKWGVGHDWQAGLDLPMEQHDVVWDCILTPSGRRECRKTVFE